MGESKIINENIGTKYRVVFEQAASTKGVMGFKMEANGDSLKDVMLEARILASQAKDVTTNYTPPVEVK